MRIDGNIIKAEDGKCLKRISDGKLMGWRVYLGYTHYLGGKKLETPILERPEHYEEADEPPMSEEERGMYRMMREEGRMREEMEREMRENL